MVSTMKLLPLQHCRNEQAIDALCSSFTKTNRSRITNLILGSGRGRERRAAALRCGA
jgi:hypothetical protein